MAGKARTDQATKDVVLERLGLLRNVPACFGESGFQRVACVGADEVPRTTGGTRCPTERWKAYHFPRRPRPPAAR